MAIFKINKKIIDSSKNDFYLIAEIAHNHMGDLDLAMKMIVGKIAKKDFLKESLILLKDIK